MRDFNIGTVHTVFGHKVLVRKSVSCAGCAFTASDGCLLANVNGFEKMDVRPCVCRKHDSRAVIYVDMKNAADGHPFPALYVAWLHVRSGMIERLWQARKGHRKAGSWYHAAMRCLTHLLEWME